LLNGIPPRLLLLLQCSCRGRAGGRAGGTLSRPIGLFGGKTKKKKKALSVGWLAVVSEMLLMLLLLLLLLPFLYSIAIERESSEYKKASK
jgi:hypothetical protein